MSEQGAEDRPLPTIRRFAIPISSASSTIFLSAIQVHIRCCKGGLMAGLPELFFGLGIIGAINGVIVTVAVVMGRKEKGTVEAGRV